MKVFFNDGSVGFYPEATRYSIQEGCLWILRTGKLVDGRFSDVLALIRMGEIAGFVLLAHIGELAAMRLEDVRVADRHSLDAVRLAKRRMGRESAAAVMP